MKLPDLESLRDRVFGTLQTTVDSLNQESSAMANETGKKANDHMMDLLRKQNNFIQGIASEPKPRATVLTIQPSSVNEEENTLMAVVSYQGLALEVKIPKDMAVQPGDEVSLLNSTLQPTAVVKDPLGIGDIAIVSQVLNDTRSQVLFRGAKRLVLNGLFAGKLEVGDYVVVDSACVIVIRNLGKTGNGFEFTGATGVSWDGIIGCATAKEKLRDAIETPYLRPDVYEHYHDEPPKGVLLIGVPGCGKTMLLKACVTAHRVIHKENAFVLFVSGAELLRGIVGETEELIRQLFAFSRAHFRKTGVRALLVMDEAEALLAKRGSGRSSDVEKTNVPTFLGEMNGLDSVGNPIVLLATNRPDMMDDAIMRDERMDEIIVIPPPTKADAPAFFSLYLKNVPLETDIADMATFATDEFFSGRYSLATVVRKSTNAEEHFTLGHVVNGAMLRGIVRRAKGIARRRDLAAPPGTLGVVTKDDIRAGVADAFEKNKHLDYRSQLLAFLQGFDGDLAEPDKVLKSTF